eukprot:TRINITY_DN38783_c0_g1_i2.p1 TRINITY_DN38783_c0_g1~~TRINITY_DN38783_c0_g1_i2.p1  ORF type:complete len:272 (+),score=44.66 TRINITY_DN38783_c0_g1_i2:101-916(+)
MCIRDRFLCVKQLHAAAMTAERTKRGLLRRVLARLQSGELCDAIAVFTSKLQAARVTQERHVEALRALKQAIGKWTRDKLLETVRRFKQGCDAVQILRERRAQLMRRILARWRSTDVHRVFVTLHRHFSVAMRANQHKADALFRVMARWQFSELSSGLKAFTQHHREDKREAATRVRALKLLQRTMVWLRSRDVHEVVFLLKEHCEADLLREEQQTKASKAMHRVMQRMNEASPPQSPTSLFSPKRSSNRSPEGMLPEGNSPPLSLSLIHI